MTQKPPQPHTKSSQNNLAECILRRIESEQIEPTPRWYFLCMQYLVWFLWFLSVVIGALAIAVMLYVSMHASYALYEVTHETVWEFIIEVVPVLWLCVFLLMAGIAYVNLRHTKKGYRYPVWHILLSSLLMSIVGGSLLHMIGAGYITDSFMQNKMPLYSSFEKLERQWWQRPEEGMLVGRLSVMVPEHKYVLFADIDDERWRMQIDELSPTELELLQSGKLVKVLGVRSGTTTGLFHGCGVFPWMYERSSKMSDIRRERLEFVQKMNTFKQKVAEHFATSSGLVSTSTTRAVDQLLPMPVCASLPLMKKMP